MFTQFIHDLPCLAMFTQVYARFTLFSHVYPSLYTMYTVYPWILQFLQDLTRLAMFTVFYPCFTPFTHVYPSLSTLYPFSHAYHDLSTF